MQLGHEFSTPMNGWLKTTSDQHMPSFDDAHSTTLQNLMAPFPCGHTLSSGLDFATCSSAQVGDWAEFPTARAAGGGRKAGDGIGARGSRLRRRRFTKELWDGFKNIQANIIYIYSI